MVKLFLATIFAISLPLGMAAVTSGTTATATVGTRAIGIAMIIAGGGSGLCGFACADGKRSRRLGVRHEQSRGTAQV